MPRAIQQVCKDATKYSGYTKDTYSNDDWQSLAWFENIKFDRGFVLVNKRLSRLKARLNTCSKIIGTNAI